jgi:tetratricopeptide (TPR) repeat protein
MMGLFMGTLGSRSRSFLFHPKNLVVLLAAAVLLVLRWKYRLSLLYFILFFVIPLIIFYLVLPLIARKRFPDFEKKVRILHMKSRWEDALTFYRKNLLMRAFGPVPEVKKLLGQIHAFLFKWESAREAFSESLESAGRSPDLAAVTGFAEACFHTGRDREAERALAGAAFDRVHLPQAAYYKIHLVLEDDKKRKYARKEFENFQWDEDRDGAIKLLTLSEIKAEEKKLDSAYETLKQVDRKKLPQPLRYMAKLLEGRILLLQGKTREAGKLLDDLSKNSPSGRHRIELEDFDME